MARRNNRRDPVQISSGAQLPQAATSLLVVRYPAALDSPPNPIDRETPLSGLYLNYLGLMLEAIQAEVGPIKEIVDHDLSLLAFLGTQTQNALSAWRSITKTFGGNEAGQVFGTIKATVVRTGAGYNIVTTTGFLTSWQGAHPANTNPIVFLTPVQGPGLTSADMVDGVAGGVRGFISGSTATPAFQVSYRGHPSDASQNSTGSASILSDLLLFFLVTSF